MITSAASVESLDTLRSQGNGSMGRVRHQGTEGVRQDFCKATDLTFAFEDRKHDRSFAITKVNEVVVVRQLILLVQRRPFAHCYRMN